MVLAHDRLPAGAHSCGSAPVSHRLPPPGIPGSIRDPGLPSPSALDNRHGVGRDRVRAGTLGECIEARQRRDRGTRSPGWAGQSPRPRACSSRRARSTWPVVIGICWVVVEAHAPDGPYRRAFPALIALGVAFGLFRVAIAALTTHNGIDVWWTLPHFTMPDVLGGFTVGGTVESSVVLQAVASSFTVVGMMAVFGAANVLWSHYELVQSTPRAFHELGVVVTVALGVRARHHRVGPRGPRGRPRPHRWATGTTGPAAPLGGPRARTRPGARGRVVGVDGRTRLRDTRCRAVRGRGRMVCARGTPRAGRGVPRRHRSRHHGRDRRGRGRASSRWASACGEVPAARRASTTAAAA